MDNNTNKKPNKVNMPKFNLNWLYMIIAMMLLGLYLTNESGTATKNISYDEFQQYVRDGYISKVIGYDDNSVEAYVKPQHVGNVFRQDSSRVGKNPLITTEAPSRESLGNFLQKERDDAHFDGPGPVGQWELYDIPADYTGRDALEELLAYMDAKGLDRIKAATQIMIAPLGYEFRIVRNIITNFHQPKSTLLLLVSAFAGEDWRRIYDYALSHDFRFLSYGDSSVLMR